MGIRESIRNLAPVFLIIFGLQTFWTFGYNGIWHRLQIELEGKIIARQDFPQSPSTNGPTTLYELRQGDGSVHHYTATGTDSSLPRTIPIGTLVAKHKGELFYSANGERVDDFSLAAYVALLVVGAYVIGAGLRLIHRRWY